MASEKDQLKALRCHPNYAVAYSAAHDAAKREKRMVKEDFYRQYALRYIGTCSDQATWADVLVFAAASDATKKFFTGPGEGSYAGWVADIVMADLRRRAKE